MGHENGAARLLGMPRAMLPELPEHMRAARGERVARIERRRLRRTSRHKRAGVQREHRPVRLVA